MSNAFLKHVRRFPWVTNVTLYGCLFAGGDFVHQWFSRKEDMDWRHTRNVAVVAFSFHGVSFLEGKDDILQDWREKFFNTYKTGLMFWPIMQFLNFALVPLYVRTTFTGCCAFIWATFLCFSRQSGDGTAAAALVWMFTPRHNAAELKEEQQPGPTGEGSGPVEEKHKPTLTHNEQSSPDVKPGLEEQAAGQKEGESQLQK
ncbi:mpv17-like protein isoform X3 [Osmerus eperlanus]|uniref:mpv17-like protein isoform X3 n=1 Tax=Osmerus eperlanus TaxID=29151 RepID=UPI002E0E3A5B